MTQNTGMDDDNIKFITYQENEDMDVINSKSIQGTNSQENLKCPEIIQLLHEGHVMVWFSQI